MSNWHLQVLERGPLLTVRHFAERAARFLVLSSFLSVVSQWRVACILLFRRWSRNDLDQLRKPKPGEHMSQSKWNPVSRYGESLHSSEVLNPRELKFCEGCGLLLIRLQGSKVQFCPDCERQVAITSGRLQ